MEGVAEKEIMSNLDYKAFTTEYDVIESASEIIKRATPLNLINNQKILDKINISASLLGELKRALMSYKVEMKKRYGEIPPLSILLDNSWSLRGRGQEFLAMLFYNIVPVCEELQIPVEVLWFTTRAWKWGQSRTKWLSSWKNPAPGRLNDLQHTIFHAFWEDFSQTKEGIDLLFTEGYFKENIDGEALEWAFWRISKRPERKKVILRVSDGAPADDSTLSTNKSDILEKHLQTVLERIHSSSETKVYQWFITGSSPNIKNKDFWYTDSIHSYYEWNPIETLISQVLPMIRKATIQETIGAEREKIEGILSLNGISMERETIDNIARSLWYDIVSALLEFWLFDVEKLKSIESPIICPDINVFKMNLAILKASRLQIDESFLQFIQIAGSYTSYQNLERILSGKAFLKEAIQVLKVSDDYFHLTEGQDWQWDFYDIYRGLIEEQRCNLKILKALTEKKLITRENIEKLPTVLLYGNTKMVLLLIRKGLFNVDTIWQKRDIVEFSQPKKIEENIKLLQKKNIEHDESWILFIRVCMSLSSEILNLAVRYGYDSIDKLNRLCFVIKSTSISEIEKEILQDRFTSSTLWEIKKWVMTGAWNMGVWFVMAPLSYFEWIQKFFISFQELFSVRGAFSVAITYYGYKQILNNFTKYKDRESIVSIKVRDTIRARVLQDSFELLQRELLNLSKWLTQTIKGKEPEKLMEIIEELKEIKDEEIFKMLEIDLERLEVYYYMSKIFKMIAFFDIEKASWEIGEEALGYLKKILEKWPEYIKNLGYNYKFFLEKKSRIEENLWLVWKAEDGRASPKEIVQWSEAKKAYETLNITFWASKQEVDSAYRKLARMYHPDNVQTGDLEKMKLINTAKDTIYNFYGWV